MDEAHDSNSTARAVKAVNEEEAASEREAVMLIGFADVSKCSLNMTEHNLRLSS